MQSLRAQAALIGALATALVLALAGSAAAATTKLVRYDGSRFVVPVSWPVYNLASQPNVCVRFNRHALYLGRPSSTEDCPANALGRTEAILVEPRAGAATLALSGAATQFVAHGLQVTATWGHDPQVVTHALGLQRLPATVVQAPRAAAAKAGGSKATTAASGGAVYTGLGFDACSAPSTSTMSKWSASSYRGIGVYIGGTNMACSQSNLTSSWVSTETAAGWHLIPTYVGLQAPSNGCGCAGINPSQATTEGTAAAQDAIAKLQALGLGPGNPVYFDMEAYNTTSKNSTAVMNFLSAWTAALHAGGYASGVYTSTGSGVRDLVARYGTSGFNEPDDLWFANWNGSQTTNDSAIPSSDWSADQRIHQYQGSHNATYGGATIDIDSDYVDALTAGGGSVAAAPYPSLKVSPTPVGSVKLHARWTRAQGIASWEVLGGAAPTGLAAVMSSHHAGTTDSISAENVYPYYAVEALGSAGQVLGTSPPVATPPHLAIYGHSSFAPRSGLAGVPAGCFTGSACQITTTVYDGKTVIARTKAEHLGANSGGLLYFNLTSSGHSLLSRARGRQLPVRVVVRDASGVGASANLNLVEYLTSGADPPRKLHNSRTLRLIGATDFVSHGVVGGVLAGCFSTAPCDTTTKLTVGRTTVARTGKELLGANEVGYLNFKLTGAGKSLLARASGNQLGVNVKVSDAGARATGSIALVSFG